MKNIFYYLVFVSAIVALFAFAFSFSKGDELDAEKIFINAKCNKCHSIEILKIESTSKKEPFDLSKVGSERNAEFLTKYLLKEETLNDKKHKKEFKGTDEELQVLVDWLLEQKSEE
jgi:hypothetical protein